LFTYCWLILIAPVTGFIVLSWYGNQISRERAGLIGCGTVGVSFAVTLAALSELVLDSENKGGVSTLYNWVTAGSFSLDLSILVDPLSIFMLLIVTGSDSSFMFIPSGI